MLQLPILVLNVQYRYGTNICVTCQPYIAMRALIHIKFHNKIKIQNKRIYSGVFNKVFIKNDNLFVKYISAALKYSWFLFSFIIQTWLLMHMSLKLMMSRCSKTTSAKANPHVLNYNCAPCWLHEFAKINWLSTKKVIHWLDINII